MTPKEAKTEPTKTLYLATWWVHSYDPSIEGVEPITQAGTRVPARLEKRLRQKATRAGLSLSTTPR